MSIGHSPARVADRFYARPAALLVTIAACTFSAACSGRVAPVEPRTESAFIHDLGEATARDLATEVPDILLRLGYDLIRTDGPPRLRFETAWRPRQPTADEARRGFVRTDTRVILTAIPHRGVPTAVPLYTVTLRVATRGQREGDRGWRPVPMTPESAALGRVVADRLEAELRAIVRRYG